MDQKYGEFVGVDSLYYALVSTDDADSYVAGTPAYLAPAAEVAGAPEINNQTTYYDNLSANNYVTEGKTELKVTVSNVPADLMATLLGKHYDAAAGRVYDSGQADPPKIALGFRLNMGANKYRYYWYLAGTLSGGEESAATKKENVEIKTYQLTFTAVATTHKWTIDGESKPLKRVFGDTADAAFDATGWFSQVQTPDTETPPSAVALSLIVPADGADSVAKTTTVVLTFNNKISSQSIGLFNTDTGAAVAFTGAWDSAGKVYTITPTSQLAATTKHLVSIAGVVDVYGQALATSGSDFTTGA